MPFIDKGLINEMIVLIESCIEAFKMSAKGGRKFGRPPIAGPSPIHMLLFLFKP